MRYFIAFTILTTCSSVTGIAQEQPSLDNSSLTVSVSRRAKPRTQASLRLDVDRVLIPVTVTDPDDRKVQGLRKQDFRLLEDGVPQEVSEFFEDESPVSVGIVLDSSNSMRNKIDSARQAIRAFLRLSLPEDEFFLITVQDQPELVHAFTSDHNEITQELANIQPRGWTALYDSIYLGINHLKRARTTRRVLLVLSDGGDNNSRYTESEIRSLVRESDVRIFTVSLLGRSPSVEKLSAQSGGRAFLVHKLEDLPDTAVALSSLVHGEYVLGFKPASPNRDGKFHTIQVELNQAANATRLHTSWRHGYYAPVE